MYGWSSIGSSSYHALQVNLRKQVSHGLQFDMNYTYSKSIDITSRRRASDFRCMAIRIFGLVGKPPGQCFFPQSGPRGVGF